MFFSLPSWAVALIVFGVIAAACVAGAAIGRYLRVRHDTLKEPIGVVQGALLGVVGLILAFGLTLAVGRYQDRRSAAVAEANAIETAYLRAQTIAEPARSRSLTLLRQYADLALLIGYEVPSSAAIKRTTAAESALQRRLWSLAGSSLSAAPTDSSPRLYVDSLNAMFDQQAARLAALNNRVPGAVLGLEVLGGALALGLLALYLSVLGRGHVTMILAAGLVTMLLLVTFDLDRPTRGLIKVPDTALQSVRAAMTLPPAAKAP
ncbi:MAG TPA: hypothetical protein VGF23_21820 [Gaiellaceae bacterium]